MQERGLFQPSGSGSLSELLRCSFFNRVCCILLTSLVSVHKIFLLLHVIPSAQFFRASLSLAV